MMNFGGSLNNYATSYDTMNSSLAKDKEDLLNFEINLKQGVSVWGAR
jgi:hypothetical protein